MNPAPPIPLSPAAGDLRPHLLRRVLAADLPAAIVTLVYRYRIWLTVFTLAIYLLGFNGRWRVEPDAALYLSLGRNLAEGHGYTHLGKPHHLAYPGLPWIIAATFKVFRVPHLWPAHVLMLAFALGALLLTYRLFLLHADRPTATFLTFGVAFTKTFYRFAYELRPDMPFLFGVMAFLCGFEAIFAHPERAKSYRWFDWLLLVGGLCVAMVMRPTIWVLVGAIAIAAVWSAVRGHWRWKTLLPFLIGVAILVFAFRHFDPRFSSSSGTDDYETYARQSLTTHFGATLHTVLAKNLHVLLSVATPDALLQVRMGWANVVLGVVIIALGVGLVYQHVLWGVFVGLVVVMNVLVPPLDRYYLPVVPLLVYAWWLGLSGLRRRWHVERGGPTNVLLVALLLLGLGSNLTKIGGIIIEQRHVPFLRHYQNGKFVPIQTLANDIKQHVEPDGLVIVPHGEGRILSFLSHHYVADPRDFAGLNLDRPLYLVEPTDPATDAFLTQSGLTPGQVVVPADAAGARTFSLYRLRRVSP